MNGDCIACRIQCCNDEQGLGDRWQDHRACINVVVEEVDLSTVLKVHRDSHCVSCLEFVLVLHVFRMSTCSPIPGETQRGEAVWKNNNGA